MTTNPYWIYILECNNNTYYIGYTNDLARRYSEHVTGTAKCKYTRSFKPIRIAQSWLLSGSKADALKIERYLKSLSRQTKKAFIQMPEKLLVLFHNLDLQVDKKI